MAAHAITFRSSLLTERGNGSKRTAKKKPSPLNFDPSEFAAVRPRRMEELLLDSSELRILDQDSLDGRRLAREETTPAHQASRSRAIRDTASISSRHAHLQSI